MSNEEITDVELVEKDTASIVYQDKVDADVVIHNIDAQEKVLERLIKYMKDKLQPQVDYYSVKESAKPSLGLPGAEKICNIFNLVGKPILEEKVRSTTEVYYEYICELYHKYTGKFAGSGVGCCSSQEGKYRSSSAIDIANTIKKMAYKRAFVDATLKSTMASFLFTQDLEDYFVGNVGAGKPTGAIGTKAGNFPTNREYWDKYEWDKVDMAKKPPKLKGKKQSMEALKIYFYAKDLMPQDQIEGFFDNLTGKKTWSMTYEDIKKVVDALIELDDSLKKEQTPEGQQDLIDEFEEQENE